MVNYRREYILGSTVFLTITLKNRQSDWLCRYINELRNAIQTARQRSPFDLIAICVLPEHLHIVMQLPTNEGNFSHRVRLIKSLFSQRLAKKLALHPNTRGEYEIWQRRFWEHTIKNEEDLQRCVDYVHFNPVKHGLVTQVKDWPFSSFHRAVKEGRLAENWGSENVKTLGDWGE
ncbi:REP-associated tyrosine transposase [Agitococcus lubricus]|uniref:Putative transposase n=1 Tax=Agitococcus lubricus TaxID=1077255 RepID=A0A2T5IUG5_9GAMM|nr:transposase [Agitococcus lubricus]PTQ87514.1 putative transposase [Agitococcus lubricus]